MWKDSSLVVIRDERLWGNPLRMTILPGFFSRGTSMAMWRGSESQVQWFFGN
jgi:hypothetical protein